MEEKIRQTWEIPTSMLHRKISMGPCCDSKGRVSLRKGWFLEFQYVMAEGDLHREQPDSLTVVVGLN